jgi:crotonobetainyl-CoA:carnitine CoA-transferase CaiB-like acyl-CoA transferase
MSAARAGLPLHGVRVVDLSRYVAGPYCASILADLGADVIRVEPVGGGEDRELVPLGGGPGGALFLQTNRNKRSMELDTKSSAGRKILERLIATADAVITNMPAKALKRLGLDRASLEGIKPGIVTANVSAFGMKGRLSDRNGFDGVGQCMSGAAYLGGKRNSPARAGCSYVDYGTGLAAALGVVAALLHRDRGGPGMDVQASLLATALTFANGWHIEAAVRGMDRKPFGNLSPNSAPSDIYRTQDGFIVVQVIGGPMFARWATLVGRPELASDRRHATDAARGKRGRQISKIMQAWASGRTSREALEILAQHGLPAGPVYSPRQLIEDELVAETGMLQPVEHSGLARAAPIAAPIVRFGGVDDGIRAPAPEAGADTVAVLESLGLGEREIAELEQMRVVSSARMRRRLRRKSRPSRKNKLSAIHQTNEMPHE